MMKMLIPICHHCNQTRSVRKHGKGRSTGTQRYYCQSCKKTFQTKYIYKGNEAQIARQVTRLISQGNTPEMIGAVLQVGLSTVRHYLGSSHIAHISDLSA
ncbi:hypothetical protein [Budvicia aquatica]|uniref:Transposase and inactivated derivatives n=1 Tax=Budvicia aquatica TaxID=82979 RepID=A0A2C6DUT3_9GAMM|nr:hypothetical protein [Budvicia aquatica]PHI28831.1 hypothetical protein CRN84_05655 [Budvicia aquatica]PHI32235.1 hypothetical protein CRN84_24405 [Budvicia aquatica]VFS45148.1 Transposase and inactivated derivatives [Budvicia aquatica]VFS46936.1 Transposase and inactivated derivatives [Budvicia aquatica]